MELTALEGTENDPFHLDCMIRQTLSLWNGYLSLIFSRCFQGPLLRQLVQLRELRGIGPHLPRLQQTSALKNVGGFGMLIGLQDRSLAV